MNYKSETKISLTENLISPVETKPIIYFLIKQDEINAGDYKGRATFRENKD